jgi:hypothetical protein
VRYYIKCKLNPNSKDKLANSITSGNLAKGKIFYEGMQSALRTATIDETDTVHFIETCYCLEGGLYPMAMEIPTLKKYFESVEEVKDARFREKCTMECEACDCTRAIKLPGIPLLKKLNLRRDDIDKKEVSGTEFVDYGRVKLNRQKQRQGIDALKKVLDECQSLKIKPVMAGAAISGLFAIFHDDNGEYFRIKNIPDTNKARHILDKLGLDKYNSVQSAKENAKCSLARSDRYSNVV